MDRVGKAIADIMVDDFKRDKYWIWGLSLCLDTGGDNYIDILIKILRLKISEGAGGQQDIKDVDGGRKSTKGQFIIMYLYGGQLKLVPER